MRRWFLSFMTLLLVLLLPVHAMAADYTVDGITYFTTSDQKQASMDQLLRSVFLTPYDRAGHSGTLLDRWLSLAIMLEQVNNTQNYQSWFDAMDKYGNNYISYYAKKTDMATSVANADNAIRSFILSGQGLADPYYVPASIIGDPGLSDIDGGYALYSVYVPHIKVGDPMLTQEAYYAYAVILSNFSAFPVVTGDYIKSIPKSAWVSDYKFTPTSTNVDFTKNEALETVTTKHSLKNAYTETLTTQRTSGFTHTDTRSVTAGLSINLNQFLPVSLSSSVTMTMADAWSDMQMRGEAKSNLVDKTVEADVTLPGNTRAAITQQIGKTEATLNYDYPAGLGYTAYLIRYSMSDFSQKYPSKIIAVYDKSAFRATKDSADDLYKRATGVATDPEHLYYAQRPGFPTTYDFFKPIQPFDLARDIGYNIPMSKGGAMISYVQDGTSTTVGAIEPLYDLKSISIPNAAEREIALTIGDSKYIGDIRLKGVNERLADYYGFTPSYGSWIITDESGAPTSSIAVAQLISGVGGAVSVKANGEGTVYLKYRIQEDKYRKVDAPATFIKNSDLVSTAEIKVTVSPVDPGYTLVASGEVDISVNDTVDLTALPSIWASLLDKTGKAVPANFTWEAQELERDGITIENGKLLRTSAVRTYHVRACWGKLYSNWLPVDSKAARALTTITLSDPDGAIGDWRWDGTKKVHDLTKLKAVFRDQYGKDIVAQPVKWFVAKDGAPAAEMAQARLTADGAGTYACYAQAGAVRSNILTMQVFEAPALKTLTIKDDPAAPILSDYILASGSDAFEIDALSVWGYDGSGAPIALKPGAVAWFVNDIPLPGAGSRLTVTAPGRYAITAKVGQVTSNTLTLVVQPARTPSTLTLADDPASPLLADYILGSGSDRFDLGKLSVKALDQYGESAATGEIAWQVNGAALSGSVLTVDRAGDYQISATTLVGERTVRSNALKFTVTSGSADFTLNKTVLSLGVRDSFTLTAQATREDVYTFSSGASRVATVDRTGLIRALRTGSTTIKVKNTAGLEKTCLLTVVAAPKTLRFDASRIKLTSGDEWTLKPILAPAGCAATITYTSSNDRTATVDSTGKIQALADGNAVITAVTHNGLKARVTLSVSAQNVSDSFPLRLYLGENESITIDALISANAPDPMHKSTWKVSSLSPDIVEVRDGGIVARAIGDGMLRATNAHGQSVLCHVSVGTGASGVALSKDKLVLTKGSDFSLKTLLPAEFSGRVAYRSTKPGVVRAQTDGTITALKTGKANVIFTLRDELTMKLTVSVIAAPKSIKLNHTSLTLGAGEKAQLTAMSGRRAIEVMWHTSDGAIVSVDKNGGVKAVSPGQAIVTAVASNGHSAACEVKVAPAPAAFKMPQKFSLGLGEKRVPRYEFLPSGAQAKVAIESGNPSVITIDKSGKLVARNRGEALLTFTAHNAVTVKVPAEVLSRPASVRIEPKMKTMAVGETVSLAAILPPDSAGECTFKSGNSAVVTVDPLTGEAKALRSGKARIIVTTYNKKQAFCQITVR